MSKLLPALTVTAFAAALSFNAVAAEKTEHKYGAHGTHATKEHAEKSKSHVEHDEAHAKTAREHAEKDEAHAKKAREDYEKGKEKK